MAADCLRWNVPSITSERFDDEVVIVNFESGRYHSIQGDGVAIWHWLEQPATADEVVARALARFEGEAADLERAVRAFVGDLTREGLVVTAPPAEAPPGSAGDGPAGRTAFRPPALTTFTDMQELLWLDPIHEVDESGWPVVRHEPDR
jgi:hypothetical protein